MSCHADALPNLPPNARGAGRVSTGRTSAARTARGAAEAAAAFAAGRGAIAETGCFTPPTTMPHTGMSRIAMGSTSSGLRSSTVKSASLPARSYRFTTHAVHQITVEFGAAPDLAAVETYGVSVHRGDPAKPHQNLATAFRYLDRFERRAGVWKIASRVAIGDWSLRLPAEAWWDIPESHRASARDASDPIYALLAGVGIEDGRRDGGGQS